MDNAPDPVELVEAKYANYFKLSHGAEEFLVDFGQLFDEHKVPSFHLRIVMPPAYAETLWRMLGEVLSHYREIQEASSVSGVRSKDSNAESS